MAVQGPGLVNVADSAALVLSGCKAWPSHLMTGDGRYSCNTAHSDPLVYLLGRLPDN